MSKKVVVVFIVSVLAIVSSSIYFMFFHSTENIVEAVGSSQEEKVKEVDFKNYKEFTLDKNEEFEKGSEKEEVSHNEEYVYGNERYHITYTTWNKENKRVMYIEDKKENRTYATKRLDWTTNFPKTGLINWVFEYKGNLYGLNLLGNIIEIKLDGASVNILGEAMTKTKIKNAKFLGINGDYLYLRQGDKLYSYNLSTKKNKLLIKSKKYELTDVFFKGYIIVKDTSDNKVYLSKVNGENIEIIKEIKPSEKVYFNDDTLVSVKGEEMYSYNLK